jgi:hypothetical protein
MWFKYCSKHDWLRNKSICHFLQIIKTAFWLSWFLIHKCEVNKKSCAVIRCQRCWRFWSLHFWNHSNGSSLRKVSITSRSTFYHGKHVYFLKHYQRMFKKAWKPTSCHSNHSSAHKLKRIPLESDFYTNDSRWWLLFFLSFFFLS